ncbi:MAG: membrane protein insertase YidC [Clostridia bacterium]|nr:membrane protein insertase YidC [Clostridia bacterium]
MISTIFGYIMNLIYNLVNNYGIAIIIFTIITKILLFPLNILIQKNSIKMVKMKPRIEELRLRYEKNKDEFMEAQLELYKQERYRPSIGVIPLLIQIPIILGLIKVMENSSSYIENLKSTFFCGIDLSVVPTMNHYAIVPVISAISSLLLCYFQNKENVLQLEENIFSKVATTLVTVGLTVYFVFLVPTGVGIYWILGNFIAIVQLYILNWMYPPKKYIDYAALEKIKKIKLERKNKKALEKRESRKYYKKFFESDNIDHMKLIFFSEGNGFYKYFKGIIEYILENSDIVIHYITNDINDKIFEMNHKRIAPYYISTNQLIPLFMKIEADMVVMITPDLQNLYLKRSIVRKDVEYVLVPHGVGSDNLTLRTGALDYYDTYFAVGKHNVEDVREIEELRNTKKKRVIEYGYDLLDNMIKSYIPIQNEKKIILIAPSWQEKNIIDSCVKEIVEGLLGKEYKIIIRPHPQYVKLNYGKIEELLEEYKDKEEVEIQTDFSSNSIVYNADLLITDWSSIAYEYSFTTLKPTLFINTPMKVINRDYKKIKNVPFDISIRQKIGKELKLNEIDKIYDVVKELIENPGNKEKIEEIRKDSVFNIGNSAEVGGKYIIDRIKNKKNE